MSEAPFSGSGVSVAEALAPRSQQLRPLGRTRLKTSLLGFGAAPIGNLYQAMSDAQAQQSLSRALALGISYLDTAPHYGFGLSEARIGHLLAELPARPLVSTKVGRLLVPCESQDAVRHGFADAPPLEPVFDYSYGGVMRSYEASVRRLGEGRIDILFAHDLGELTHGESHEQRFKEFLAGGYKAMRELRDQGQICAIGLGANEWQVCARLMAEVELDCVLLAGRYTLLEQGACESFLPACAQAGVSVILGGPFNSGILAKGVSGPGPHHYNYGPAPAEIVARVARLEAVCTEFAVPLAAAALQFPTAHPVICSVIAGLASSAEVEQAVSLINLPLPADFWQALRERELIHPAAPLPDSA